jgi:hypothetical protein
VLPGGYTGNMAVNRGVAPPNTGTDVGRMRYGLGDSDYVALVPAEAGFGNYQLFSDDELEVLLLLSGGNVARAIAIAYRKIGASWASTGATIKTDDLTYSAKDSVGNWLNLASYWDKVADDQEQRAANDYFDLVDVGAANARRPGVPEGSPAHWLCSCSLTVPCSGCSSW